jgi:hypothetical protein
LINRAEKIKISLDFMYKISALSSLIYDDLKDDLLDAALEKIANRARLLNIVQRTNGSILLMTDLNIQALSEWKSYTFNWSQEEEKINQLIEFELHKLKSRTTEEIASIFNNKSRHKGYDLSSLK